MCSEIVTCSSDDSSNPEITNPDFFPTKMTVVIYILQYIRINSHLSSSTFVDSGFVILSDELIIIGSVFIFFTLLEVLETCCVEFLLFC